MKDANDRNAHQMFGAGNRMKEGVGHGFLFYWQIVLSVKYEEHPVLAQRLKSGNLAFLMCIPLPNIFGKVKVNHLVKRCCSVLVDSFVLCILFYIARWHPLHEPSNINPSTGMWKRQKTEGAPVGFLVHRLNSSLEAWHSRQKSKLLSNNKGSALETVTSNGISVAGGAGILTKAKTHHPIQANHDLIYIFTTILCQIKLFQQCSHSVWTFFLGLNTHI